MQIHNFFSDVLLSIRTLLDNIIFKDTHDYIKHYQFNIANGTFQLDYNTSYAFPAAIISLDDDSYSFGERTNVIHQQAIENFNQIRVLDDDISHFHIAVQEEHVKVNVTIQINCESPLQAKETEFCIKRFLPFNKYIQLFEFQSFLEISPEILLTYGIDFNRRSIPNLYNKLNTNLGNIEYCFGIIYKPLILLNSSSVTISEGINRSFPLILNLTYQIQMPMWICGDKTRNITRINVDFFRFGNDPISSVVPLVISNSPPNSISRRSLLIHNLNDYELTRVNLADAYIFKVKFNKNDFIISPEFTYNIFDIHKNIHRDVKPTLVDTDLNSVSFKFTEDEYNRYYRANITKPIILQFIQPILS